ncbi:MAG: glycoside hydrolase family 3 N-terminal domain-containing protein [Spirochaetota bacterium]
MAEKVGQLFILAFPGKDYKKAARMISDYHISGCYISQDNAETFAEARELSETLQNASLHASGLPLVLGVDQEGAWGVLLPEATIGPGNLALGVADDTRYTEKMYGIFAQEMRSASYNTILAPCADVNLDPHNPIIGTRSFGEEPTRVAAHVRTAVTALRRYGVLCSAKHFPGHGDTHCDTHREIPSVDKPLAVLRNNELLPFQAAIDAGVHLIMTSHIRYPQLDETFPATLSYKILTNLLREQMGFRGVVITDSMNMGAMRKFYDPGEAAVLALLAGADLVMLSEEHYDHSPAYWDKQRASIEAVRAAVEAGRISAELLEEKLERIAALRQGLLGPHPTQGPHPTLGPQTEREAAMAAIRILRNESQILPLPPGARVALINATPRAAYHNLLNVRGIGPNQATPAFDSFAESFCSRWPQAQVLDYGSEHSAYDVVLVVTEDHPLPGEDFDKTVQVQRVQGLLADQATRDRLLILALRSPYDLPEFADALCYVCTYSGRSCAAQAAAEFLATGGATACS